MNDTDIAVKFEGIDKDIRSLEHRMDDVEKDHDALNKIAQSVAVMASEQKNIGEKVEKIDEKVTALEAKPGKKWDKLIEIILSALGGAFVAWILSGGMQ